MAHFAPYLFAGLAAFVAADYVPAATRHLGVLPASLWSDAAPAIQGERSRKGDRMAAPRDGGPHASIATVEVVGLRDAAIVYRDREGRELYRTDPVSNVTVVSKGLLLPEVTVKQHANSSVKPVPVEVRDQPRERKAPASPQRKIPIGCEPAFSPVAQPSMAHHMGRCIAEIEGSTKLAMR
jgi:hypothetical protein